MSQTKQAQMADQTLVRVVAKLTVPFILILGLYVILHGELGPGGGFQGGVILAAAMILYGLVFGADEIRRRIPIVLLDSCMACAVLSALPKGTGFTTMEFKVSLLRPLTKETGIVRAEGTLLSRGRRGATAEGRLSDANGKLLAHATTTCLIFEF